MELKDSLKSIQTPIPNSDRTIDLVTYTDNPKCFDNKQLTWIKVVARKGLSIHEHCLGRSDSSNRTLLDQVVDLSFLAAQTTHHYSSIKLVLDFKRGVTESIKKFLEKVLNIQVNADEVFPDPYENEYEILLDEYDEVTRVPESYDLDLSTVNIDITTLLTLSSNLTHSIGLNLDWRSSNYNLIAMQAEDQLVNDQLPRLKSFLEGKTLIISQTAFDEFQEIVSKVSGPNERKRAEELLKKVKIVPDQASQLSLTLPNTSKFSKRSINVFGTGDSLKVPTITANHAFIRAAGQAGVNFCVLLHEPRVLSEQKQLLLENEQVQK